MAVECRVGEKGVKSHAALKVRVPRSKEQSDGNLKRLQIRVNEPIGEGIRGVERLRTGGRIYNLAIGDLLRDYGRHGIEVRIVLCDGSTV